MKNKIIAEFIGTMFLVAAIVGSGFMATNLTDDVALQLLIDGISATTMLAVIIALFKDISGAHFNPIVSLYKFFIKELDLRTAFIFIVAQILGAISGSKLANLMFSNAPIGISNTNRQGLGLFLGEVVASFGLVLIVALKKGKPEFLIPAWIASAYFFTSSTSFANPAVTIGRIFTDSFAGISPKSVATFIAAQFIGMFLVLLVAPILKDKK